MLIDVIAVWASQLVHCVKRIKYKKFKLSELKGFLYCWQHTALIAWSGLCIWGMVENCGLSSFISQEREALLEGTSVESLGEDRILVNPCVDPGLPSKSRVWFPQAAALFLSSVSVPLSLPGVKVSLRDVLMFYFWVACLHYWFVSWSLIGKNNRTSYRDFNREKNKSVYNIRTAFMSQENCDHTVTPLGTSLWVILHPVVDRHNVSAVLSELKL